MGQLVFRESRATLSCYQSDRPALDVDKSLQCWDQIGICTFCSELLRAMKTTCS